LEKFKLKPNIVVIQIFQKLLGSSSFSKGSLSHFQILPKPPRLFFARLRFGYFLSKVITILGFILWKHFL
jgi:hypothetical protein